MNKTFDPFDELAAMFLTAPADPSSATEVARPQCNGNGAGKPRCVAPVELLVAGHLPVRGGLWLTPYADAVARERGCAALIRLEHEESSLQVLGSKSDQIETGQDLMLRQAVAQVGMLVDHWIIRAAPGSNPIELLSANAEQLTILSSADEAAIVAAYQLIKDFTQAAEQLHKQLPSIGLAIVGADQKTAATTIERLNRTTASFLGVEAKLVRCLPRIDTGIKSTRCLMFPAQENPRLGELMNWIDQIRTVAAQRPDDTQAVAGKLYADRDASVLTAEEILRAPQPEAPAPEATRSPFIAPAQPGSIPGMSPFRIPAPASPSVPDIPLQPAAQEWTPHVEFPPPASRSPLSPPIKLAPKPMIDVEPKGSARATEPAVEGKPVALASHVPGLCLLPFRSPGHERIEIAVDGHGCLHLLGREQSIRDLAIVESWVRAHRELIALACPHNSIDHATKAICHVFTAEPVSVADLHGSDLRLHVLAPVVVNGITGWYAAPLNALAR